MTDQPAPCGCPENASVVLHRAPCTKAGIGGNESTFNAGAIRMEIQKEAIRRWNADPFKDQYSSLANAFDYHFRSVLEDIGAI